MDNYKPTPEEIQAKKDELKQIMDSLEKGVNDVVESDNYKRFLTVMAHLPRYSINNQILIWMQNPKATMCNSFTGWKQCGRHVKSGEKGLRILAPAPYQVSVKKQKKDAGGKVILDTNGEPVTEEGKITVHAFKAVTTFDVSQTDGDPIPSIGIDELNGDVADYDALFSAIKAASPVPVNFEDITTGAKGYYSHATESIALKTGMSELQTIKTLLHEIAHATYHSKEALGGAVKSREQKECEAESIAFVVATHYGLDVSDYSFGYIANWSSGKETPELKDALQLINTGSREIIESIDKQLSAAKAADKTA